MPVATAPLASRSPQSVAVDNLLRRELRIGDPADPGQVAGGLLARYPDALDQMRREREGLNYGGLIVPTADAAVSPNASCTELALARNDLERDIASLTHSSELKDIDVELKGWGRAVRQAASDGMAAATLALDIVQNDCAMAARRVLGDYARLARYVGSLSADTGPLFRRFAQSCDVMAALVLVGIGEGLAANGITRGTALIRVSASELQSRRNAVIMALRSLTGSASVALGQDEYPRGLEAYRILTRQLEQAGQADLRTLLNESTLAAALDQLVDLAVGATSSGLRELTTTASLVVNRVERLISYCRAFDLPAGELATRSTPDSPPMVYFASALQMFVDAFTMTKGGRLLFIARPPILAYGLYGRAGPDEATRNLIDLTMARGALAELADCIACCSCDEASTRREVLVDYFLYRIDRAIDLYAVGSDPAGRSEPEIRAAAGGLCMLAALKLFENDAAPLPANPANPPLAGALKALLENAARMLTDATRGAVIGAETLVNELSGHYLAEKQLESLVQSLSPRCNRSVFGECHQALRVKNNHLVLDNDQQPIRVRDIILGAITELEGELQQPGDISIPPDLASSMAGFAFGWPAKAQSSGNRT